jgi:catalase
MICSLGQRAQAANQRRPALISPEQAIQAVHEISGEHRGYRALHAKGFLVAGTFTATAEARALSRAAHLTGEPVPTLVRFSNGAGNPQQPDNKPGIRGMAAKFFLPNGSTTDISAQTARLFISSTPDGFIDFLRATKRDALLGWRLARYAVRYPQFFRTLRANAGATRVPVSYATVGYHALHAYRWVDAHAGHRFVRYHWLPQAGEQFLSSSAARTYSADFLTDEMKSRLAAGPVRFDLQVQIAGAKDSTTDPSAPWASTDTIAAGTLEITEPDSDRESSGHIVVFDPMRVTDGIEPSDDPVLHFRSHAYSVSVKDRTGVSRGTEAP